MSMRDRLATILALALSGSAFAQTAPVSTGVTPTAPAAPAAAPAPAVPPAGINPGAAVQQPPALAPSNNFYIAPTGPGGTPVTIPIYGGAATPAPGTAPGPAPGTPSTAGGVSSGAGPEVIRMGAPQVIIPAGTPPPRSVEAGPAGTYKLQSISGERIYLTNGLRVKLAGVTIPPGEPGNLGRKALRELVRSLSVSLVKEANSPPLGDANARVWLFLPDRRNVAIELLRQGAARINHRTVFRNDEERDVAIAAEAYARSKKLGIWARQ